MNKQAVLTSEKLYRCKMRLFGNKLAKKASLFPFFNQYGNVKVVMVLLSDVNDIYMIHNISTLISMSWFTGRISLQVDKPSLKSYSQFSEEMFSDLYHFDPWWELDLDRFRRHWAVQFLKQTNCAQEFTQKLGVESVYYATDLTDIRTIRVVRVEGVPAQHLSFENFTWEPPMKSSVFKSIRQNQTIAPTFSWQLEPIWKDWSKCKQEF